MFLLSLLKPDETPSYHVPVWLLYIHTGDQDENRAGTDGIVCGQYTHSTREHTKGTHQRQESASEIQAAAEIILKLWSLCVVPVE